MIFDYSSLLRIINSKFGTQYNFSVAMGMDNKKLESKLKNDCPWKQSEIEKASNLLRIDGEDISKYFFNLRI